MVFFSPLLLTLDFRRCGFGHYAASDEQCSEILWTLIYF